MGPLGCQLGCGLVVVGHVLVAAAEQCVAEESCTGLGIESLVDGKAPEGVWFCIVASHDVLDLTVGLGIGEGTEE